MTYKLLILWLCIINLFCGNFIYAQKKIQVVTKTLYKEFQYLQEIPVFVTGEKARIFVSPSPDKKIYLNIQLISKNLVKDSAENDLSRCSVNIVERNSGIFISNVFDTKKGLKYVKSNLSVVFDMKVPVGIYLNIKNLYGEIGLKDLVGNLVITLNFGQLSFSNLSGSLSISSNYADINGHYLKANGVIDAQKADISLTQVLKDCKITNSYGLVELNNVKAPVDISCKLSRIEISLDNYNQYAFNVCVKEGQIIVPEIFRKQKIKDSGNESFITVTGEIAMVVKTTHNDIILKNK